MWSTPVFSIILRGQILINPPNAEPPKVAAAKAGYGRAMLDNFINVLLSRKPAELPNKNADDSAKALKQWSAEGVNAI